MISVSRRIIVFDGVRNFFSFPCGRLPAIVSFSFINSTLPSSFQSLDLPRPRGLSQCIWLLHACRTILPHPNHSTVRYRNRSCHSTAVRFNMSVNCSLPKAWAGSRPGLDVAARDGEYKTSTYATLADNFPDRTCQKQTICPVRSHS